MTKSVPKLVLSGSRDIPFNKLALSQSNVRRVKAGVSIPELAEDIAQRTLLQSLSVRAVLDGEARETGMFEVPAGGRRFRALELLVTSKRMAKDQPVPCVVREGGNAVEDSYAENIQRVALHPLDQFRAFKDRRDAGLGEEEIAARFMVSTAVVRQRLRLASVSEKLLDIYADDGITLDQLMAFTVSGDPARQEQVWEMIGSGHYAQPHQIRRLLTEDSVPAADRRAKFVGLDVYQAAGGYVMRDLFLTDQGGWLQDVPLLDRLVAEKLTTEANDVAVEGWKWVEAAVDMPYGYHFGLRPITGASAELSDAEQATLDARLAEFDQLTEDWERNSDDLPEEVDQRLGELEAEIASLMNRPKVYDPGEMARAGVFVTIGHDGMLVIDRGFVRPEDEPVADAQDSQDEGSVESAPEITVGGKPVAAEEEEDSIIRPLPERLVSELTAERTLALRDALAEAPDAAFIALVHALVLSAFKPYDTGGCIQIDVKSAYLGNAAPALTGSTWSKSIKERHERWGAMLPDDRDELWGFLAAMQPDDRLRLLAHCVSLSVNALFEPSNRYNDGRVSAHTVTKRIASANHLASIIGHDMANAGWQPTRANYLDRVTKPRILEAVREARGEEMVHLIAHLKKGEMAIEAERLLDGSGWLPEPLRLPKLDDEVSAEAESAEIVALPAFLNGSGEQDDAPADVPEEAPDEAEALDPEPVAIAAE
jgi:ParB family transcriptional regulator, chromosome partitioning protein